MCRHKDFDTFKNTIEESSHNVHINKSTYNISLFLTEVLFGDNHFIELILVTNLMPIAPRNLPLHILIDVNVIPLWAKIAFQLWWGLDKPYPPAVGL